MIWEIISWIAFGLIIGFVARAIYPGSQKMSLPSTIALGITGSVLGGLIARLLSGDPTRSAFQGSGLILSIIGALIVVWAAMAFNRRRT